MDRIQFSVRQTTPGTAIRFGVSACLLCAAASACGCMSPYSNGEPAGPQAAWVQRSRPISPAPIEYDRREVPVPPILELQPEPVIDLSTESAAGPTFPDPFAAPPDTVPQTLVPPEPEAAVFPPLVPAVETPPLPMPEAPVAGPDPLQLKIDELSAQVAGLDLRLEEQARALEAAQRDTAVAQQMTQQLLAEFVAWRVELDLVRETIRAQGAADLQALDELNNALDEVLAPTVSPPPAPASARTPQMATQRRSGVSK